MRRVCPGSLIKITFPVARSIKVYSHQHHIAGLEGEGWPLPTSSIRPHRIGDRRQWEGAIGQVWSYTILCSPDLIICNSDPIQVNAWVPFRPDDLCPGQSNRLHTVIHQPEPGLFPLAKLLECKVEAGGMTIWHLPLPFNLEAIVGVGAMGSLLSRGYEVDEVEAIPASRARFIWMAGIAWGK